jgi:hypothetical protein
MAVDLIQNNWRFCQKCYSLFWYGRPDNGVCPAGEAHEPGASGNYYLVDDPEDKVG